MAGLRSFFEAAFGITTGYMCVASRRTQGKFTERFFEYPEAANEAITFLKSKMLVENVYFCPQLFESKQRVKTNIKLVSSIWADLDDCPPTALKVVPTICLETSPARYQAIWTLSHPVSPEEAEAVSRKIAYFHAEQGSDRSGWDLTQLLRIPGTFNHKYEDVEGPPQVGVTSWDDDVSYVLSDFDVYPQVDGYEYLDIPFPENMILEKGESILERYRFRLNGAVFTNFHRAPESDRSTALFRLEMYCLEAGMNLNELFQVARDSACNKFGDNELNLWKDICRAKSRFDENLKISSSPPNDEISLLNPKEWVRVENMQPTFIDRYIEWAKSVGDAAEQYHTAGAFVALSSMLAGSIQLPTSFGTIAPNLWFLLLADTTLTRKSTAMDLAMDLIMEVDEDTLMATDGSLEGLMQALSARSNIPSVFLRDEFTGLVDQMHKKDYLAGMPEFLAKIYDGKTQKRLLRKEEIKVTNPRLIVFGGGIKTKMMRIIHGEHIESGFLPRFVIITAMSDVSKVKPLGPPRNDTMDGRERILTEIRDISKRFPNQVPVTRDGKVVGITRQASDIKMSPSAWLRYNELDQTLTEIGLDSGDLAESLVPMNARLSVSILKCAMLLAAARSYKHPVEIQVEDLLKAASYGDSWRRYAQDIIVNVGKTELEGKIGLILRSIQKKGNAPRSRLMQSYHLSAREMTEIENTLVARGLITRGGEGRAVTYNSLVELCTRFTAHTLLRQTSFQSRTRRKIQMARGIAVVSGGLDSVTMLYDLIHKGEEVKVLSFDYGQRHKTELTRAQLICHSLNVEHHIVDMQNYGWLISGGTSSLVNEDVEVPEGRYDGDNMKATVVPNRNMIMLSIAAGYCIAAEAQFVATAIHSGDHAIYPDCRPDFINLLERTVKTANAGFIDPNFTFKTPYINITKTDIALIAKELQVPIEETWSCYKGGMFHCGRCGTCVERLEALHDAHVNDQTVYMDGNYWREALNRVGETDWNQPIIEL